MVGVIKVIKATKPKATKPKATKPKATRPLYAITLQNNILHPGIYLFSFSRLMDLIQLLVT